jgi:hypothetical protein
VIVRAFNTADQMKPKDAKEQLTKFIKKSGAKLGALTPADGIKLMLDFYDKVRATGCPLEEDGDMLLYQWGIYEDLDGGQSFNFDITRQFVQPGRDGDDVMSQLSLTFFFRPAAAYREFKDGNRWCSSPEDLEKFRRFIQRTQAYRKVAESKASNVKIQYSRI